VKAIISFSRFLVVGQESSKEADLRDRPAGRSLKNSPGERGLCTQEGAKASCPRNNRNDPPTERRVFWFGIVPASRPHGRVLSAVVKRVAPTERSVHRGDLAGGDFYRITAVG